MFDDPGMVKAAWFVFAAVTFASFIVTAVTWSVFKSYSKHHWRFLFGLFLTCEVWFPAYYLPDAYSAGFGNSSIIIFVFLILFGPPIFTAYQLYKALHVPGPVLKKEVHTANGVTVAYETSGDTYAINKRLDSIFQADRMADLTPYETVLNFKVLSIARAPRLSSSDDAIILR